MELQKIANTHPQRRVHKAICFTTKTRTTSRGGDTSRRPATGACSQKTRTTTSATQTTKPSAHGHTTHHARAYATRTPPAGQPSSAFKVGLTAVLRTKVTSLGPLPWSQTSTRGDVGHSIVSLLCHSGPGRMGHSDPWGVGSAPPSVISTPAIHVHHWKACDSTRCWAFSTWI